MPPLLVLWDVDHTLVNAGGVGIELYRIAFAEMFGGELPIPGSMAGRTDRAIAVEVMRLAGVPEPRRQVAAFQAIMAAHAPELAGPIRERGRALPGAAAAMAALATAGGAAAGRDAPGRDAPGRDAMDRDAAGGTAAGWDGDAGTGEAGPAGWWSSRC